MSDGFVSVPILPVFKGMSKEFAERLEIPAAEAGKRAGQAISKGLSDGVANLESQVVASKRKLDDLDRAYERSFSKQEQKRSAVKAATLDLAAAEEKWKKAVESGKSGTAELAKVERAKGSLTKATQDLRDAELELNATDQKRKDQLNDLNATLGKLQAAQAEATAEAKKSTGALQDSAAATDEAAEASKRLESWQLKAVAGFAALTGAAVVTAKGLVDIGSQFDDVYDSIRVGTGASGEAFEGLQDSFRKVAGESIGVGSDLGAIGSTLADLNTRLGVTGEPLEQLTTQFLQLQGMGVDADINTVTAAFQQFGIQADAAPGAMDSLFQISQATGRSITELTDNLSKSGPALQQFGFSFEESAGLLGALDKAGLDAEKTLGSMTKALGVFAEEGKDPQEALWGTIQRIEELTESGKNVEAIDLANSIFGAKGGAGFVAAVESGQFAYEDFLDSIGATEDTIGGLAKETADWGEKWDQVKNQIFLALEPFATQAFDAILPLLTDAVGGVKDFISSLQDLGSWINQNRDWIEPLAISVGVLTAAYVALALQQNIMAAGGFLKWLTNISAVTKIATAVQAAFNVVLSANPIALVVIALAALAAGLGYFFTQTETGKKVWAAMMVVLQEAGAWLKDTFGPMFQWLGDVASLAWVLIKAGWDSLSTSFFDGWNWLNANVFTPLAAFFTVTLPGAAQFVSDWVSDKWSWMTGKLHDGWVWVDTNVFGPFKGGLSSVRDWFLNIVDSIGRLWDGIKRKAAEPVNFVINSVFNDGILKVWNKVAGLVGLSQDNVRIPTIGGFAMGGILPGYTPGRDIYTFIEPRTGMSIGLSGGEPVLRPEAGRVLGSDWVDGINAAARVGGVNGVTKFLYGDKTRRLGGFYSGGVIGSITDWVKKYFPMMTITSTLRNTPDYHGQGKAVDFSNGTDSTPQMRHAAAMLFENYGRGLLELIHSPFSHNVKHGRDVGDGFGFYGAATMNQHRNHVHVASDHPLGDPKNMVEMVWDGAKAVIRSVVDRMSDMWNPVIDSVKGEISGAAFGGEFGKIPGAFFEKAWGAVKEFLLGKGAEVSSYSGAAGAVGNAESWREMAMAAMRRNGFNADDPAQVNAMLAQIMSESRGDPNIAQQIVDVNGTGESAGVGLLQIIPGTFALHRDPELPNDRRDPWANMNAALRYYRARYGTDLTRMWGHGHGYATGGVIDIARMLGAKLYDVGGILPHGGLAMNQSGEDEFILKHSGMRSLGDLARAVGDLVPVLEEQVEVLAKAVADPNSEQGIMARALATEFVDIIGDLGLDNVATITSAVVTAERDLLEARQEHADRLADIAEKTEALKEAQKALSEAQKTSTELSVQDKRKLEDAKRAVEEAKKPDKKGKVDTEKVSKAEEKLSRVREDLAANGVKSEEKRAEEVKKATEQVAKAEKDLAQSRLKSLKALDMPLHSVLPQISQLASEGAKAASGAGLGAVADALTGVASLAGPAGISVGVAIQGLKVGINIVKTIVGVIKKIVDGVRAARVASRKAFADGWEVIAKYASLVSEMQERVSKLQQELVRGAIELHTAEVNLRSAIGDRIVAEAEGVLSVAQARLALDKELEKSALAGQLRLMGLHEDWDSYRSLEAQIAKGTLQSWSDSAMSALMTYEAARAKAFQSELKARVDQIKAEHALAEAQRKNARNQADLLTAQERLIRMSAKVAGVDLEEATGTAQIAKLLVELAQVKSAADKNVLGRWGAALGANGSWANEYRGQRAQEAGLREAIQAVLKETGVTIEQGRLDHVLSLMAKASFRGGDPLAVLRANLPELVAAETALKINESLKPVFDARDAKKATERQLEDLRADIGLFEKTSPLEETLKGLDHTVKSLERASEAWAKGNEKLRGEYLAAAKAAADAAAGHDVRWKLDDKYATAGIRERIHKEVSIHLEGEKMYTATQIDKLLAEVTSGTGVTVRTHISSSHVAAARRKGLV